MVLREAKEASGEWALASRAQLEKAYKQGANDRAHGNSRNFFPPGSEEAETWSLGFLIEDEIVQEERAARLARRRSKRTVLPSPRIEELSRKLKDRGTAVLRLEDWDNDLAEARNAARLAAELVGMEVYSHVIRDKGLLAVWDKDWGR